MCCGVALQPRLSLGAKWECHFPLELSVHGDSPGDGVGCHFLLQEIFPAQGWNPGLPYCRWILYHQSHWGSPKCLYIPHPDNILEFSLLTCNPKIFIFPLRFFSESWPTSGLEETVSSKNRTNQQLDPCAVVQKIKTAQDGVSLWVPHTFAGERLSLLWGGREDGAGHGVGCPPHDRNRLWHQKAGPATSEKSGTLYGIYRALGNKNVPGPVNCRLKMPPGCVQPVFTHQPSEHSLRSREYAQRPHQRPFHQIGPCQV